MLMRKKKEIVIIALIIISVTAVSTITGIAVQQNGINKRTALLMEEKEKAAKEVSIEGLLREHSAGRAAEELAIPNYSSSDIHKMDMSKPSGLTAADLKLITKGALRGLEDAFIKAEKDYGVNPLFLISIASLESADGTICFRPNNMFGFGSRSYSSKEACIYDVAESIKKNYLTPGGAFYYGTTISAVNKKYAASTTWDDRLESKVKSYYSTIRKKRSEAIEKLK